MDLEDVVLSGETVYIAGEFNGWNPTSTPLNADVSYETFSVTVPALAAGTYAYKYVVNDGSDQWDWLNTDNRAYTVAGNATVDDYRIVVVGWGQFGFAGNNRDRNLFNHRTCVWAALY